MKGLELMPGGLTALEHVKIGTKVVGLNEGMSHFDAFSFHGVLFGKVIVGDGVVIEVGDFFHFCYMFDEDYSGNLKIYNGLKIEKSDHLDFD
jgi:hypothetical protein